jgi:flagellar hook-associated protein 3 FlgL
VTYTLTKTDRNGVVTTTPGLSAGPAVNGQPVPIQIQEGGQTVMAFDLKGSPAVGDTVGLTPSTSLMGTIDSAIRGIGESTNKTDATQAVEQALANIDAGLERVLQVRSYAGELLNRADRISDDQGQRSVQLEADRSRAEDLDMLKGISDFQNAHTGYQAALQSYAQVQRLSLFDFMR